MSVVSFFMFIDDLTSNMQAKQYMDQLDQLAALGQRILGRVTPDVL